MTRPGDGNEGSAWIELHSDGSKLPGEMERDVKKAAEAAEDDMGDAGDDWGKAASKSLGDRLKEEAPGIAKKLEDGLRRAKVTTKVRVEFDKDNNVVRRFEETVTTSLRDAFESASRPGGPISKIGTGIADAIGAGFNVSGRSPLIGVFALIIGAIAALVIGAIQLLNGLIAVALVVPQILASIGLQVGVLMLAFNGVGEAIAGAFSAKNPRELEEALKGLQPAAASFVKELLPLKDIFKTLQAIAQQAFFKEFAGSITKLIDAFNRVSFFEGIRSLAAVLGNTFRLITDFFSGETFTSFIKETIPLTITWLKEFGPSFTNWLDKLFGFFRKMEPFLDFFGEFFSQNFDDWARFFEDLGNDPKFNEFIESAKEGLQSIEDLLFSVTNFVIQFLRSLDEAGGQQVLQAIIDAVDQLTFFFSTDVGKKSLEGLIHFAIFALQATVGLFEAILLIFGALEALFEWLGGTAIPAIGDFFVFLKNKVVEAANAIGRFFSDLWKKITGDADNQLLGWFRGLGKKIVDIFANAGSWLFNAGQKIIGGLIAGMRSMHGQLDGHMGQVGQKVKDHLPASPAKEGPLSGRGDPMLAGQKIVQRLGEGMHMAIPELRAASSNVANNITFGAGAIQQNFQGLPTVTQAQGIGASVATGISNGLTTRDARIAIRTL